MADEQAAGAGPGSGKPHRGQWGSRLGFVLAAAGSAVGLGNLWGFPYVTSENGGGLFVLLYLACVAAIGLPIMTSEIIIGRSAHQAPVGAFQRLRDPHSAWRMVGWLGVVAGFIILSYYSVIAGWAVNYALMAFVRAFDDKTPEQIASMFNTLSGAGGIQLFWHLVFMAATVGIVIGGVQRGIEAWSRFLMPALFVLLIVLLIDAALQKGFADAMAFVFKPNTEKFRPEGALAALGQSFFSLSLGMGALITYGSYLRKEDDIPKSALSICGLDTAVALLACMIMFPVIFSFGMEPTQGEGLAFQSLPIAFSQMTGGALLAIIFFVLLVFAALTSAISLLEVVSATLIEQLHWARRKSVLVMGGAIFVFGIPSALGGVSWFSDNWLGLFGSSFLGTMFYLTAKWMLPLGGLFIAIFVGWIMPTDKVRQEFTSGTTWAWLFPIWYNTTRYLVPVAVFLVFLYSVGLIPEEWLQ